MKNETLYELLKYPGYYVTKSGHIYSNNGQKERRNKTMKLKPFILPNGYGQVILCYNKKRFKGYIHRIIAEELIPNPKNKPEVNHKDGNKMNNDIENLEWSTPSENATHMFNNLNPNKTRAMGHRNMRSNAVAKHDLAGNHIQDYENIAAACKEGFLHSGISQAASGKRNHHGGFIWKYIDNKDKEEYIQSLILKAKNFSPKNINPNIKTKPISCYDLKGNHIQDFPSINAADSIGFNRACIFSCLNGRIKTHMGLKWRYTKRTE